MAEITYWEKNFSGDIYNTNPTAKVGINNGDPLNELDVIGNIGLTEILEFKKPGHDIIQISAASELGYDFRIRNITDGRSLIYIDNLGRVGLNTNVNTARLTLVEDRVGNAWPAASFTNVSEVGFGIEVTGGNAGNNILTFKNYNDDLRGTLDGYGNWWTKGWMWSDNGTSIGGNDHYVMGNERHRFSQLLIDEETGINNEGSNFIWGRYADDGTLLAYLLKVIRNSGYIQWFGDMGVGGNLTVAGTISSNTPIPTLEEIFPPCDEGKIITVDAGGNYICVSPIDLFPTEVLDPYCTCEEVQEKIDILEEAIPTIINDYLDQNKPSLDDVATVGNITDRSLTVGGLTSPIITIGGVDITTTGDTTTIDGSTHIAGLISFESINLKIHQLSDVANSVEFAPSTHILQKLSGEWISVPLPEVDLSNYYDKQGSDERYVKVPGDTMTGGLIIDAAADNLKLITQSGATAFAIHQSGDNDPIYKIVPSLNTITTTYSADDYYLNHNTLGTIMHVDDAGTIYFGDPSKSLTELGKVVIQNSAPSLVLHNVTSNSAFRIYTSGGSTYFHVGTGLGFGGMATPVVMNSTNIELNYNSDKRLETTAAGVKIYYDLETTSAHIDGVHIYKASDGSFIIDGDVTLPVNIWKIGQVSVQVTLRGLGHLTNYTMWIWGLTLYLELDFHFFWDVLHHLVLMQDLLM